jgi:sirohydrochlorin ferrochelatase
VARYQARRPEFLLRHGYIELAQPLLAEALAALGPEPRQVTVLPLFLFAASHVKNDVPRALATARQNAPSVEFVATRALGLHPRMIDLALERACETLPMEPEDARRTTVILVGRGSSDPDANGDFCKLAGIFQEGREFRAVLPAFIAIARPRFEEVLELAARTRPERLLIVPFLLFNGQLMRQLGEHVDAFRARYSWIKTALAPHLGGTDHVLDVLDRILDEHLKQGNVVADPIYHQA